MQTKLENNEYNYWELLFLSQQKASERKCACHIQQTRKSSSISLCWLLMVMHGRLALLVVERFFAIDLDYLGVIFENAQPLETLNSFEYMHTASYSDLSRHSVHNREHLDVKDPMRSMLPGDN